MLGVLTGLGTGPAVASPAGPAASFTPPESVASVELPDGRYLVVGGCTPNHCRSVVTTAVLYDPATGQTTTTGDTLTPHGYATLTLLRSGQVLLAGGCQGRLCGQTNPTAEVWTPATGTWAATGSLIGNPITGNHPVRASAALLGSGQVLVAGGFVQDRKAQTWDPVTGAWHLTAPMRSARESFTLTTLTSGQVLAAGGCHGYYCQTILASAELYNPTTRTWSATGSLNQARQNHTARLLPTGQVRVTGGDTVTTDELYTPATGTWSFPPRTTIAS